MTPANPDALADALAEFQRRNGFHKREIEELLMEFGALVLAAAEARAAQLQAEVEAKDRALDAFASMLSDREEMAHDALQVGGLVPLDPEFEVEVPLSLLYAARTAREG